MIERELKSGDLVRLKCGGQLMVVESITKVEMGDGFRNVEATVVWYEPPVAEGNCGQSSVWSRNVCVSALELEPPLHSFKVGDVVFLKDAPGLKMSVSGVRHDRVFVDWHEDDGTPRSDHFACWLLVSAKPEKPAEPEKPVEHSLDQYDPETLRLASEQILIYVHELEQMTPGQRKTVKTQAWLLETWPTFKKPTEPAKK